jgi:hypothetical protein
MSHPEIPFTDLEILKPRRNGSKQADIDSAITEAVNVINAHKSPAQTMTHSKTVIEEKGAAWFWQKSRRFRTIKIEIVLTEEI